MDIPKTRQARARGRVRLALLALACLAPAGLVNAQNVEPPSVPTTAQPPVAAAGAAIDCACVPAGTPVVVEIAEAINSATRTNGDRFALRLAQPIVLAGVEVIPAGATGVGEVVHAARSRGGGKAGELLLAARHVEHDGRVVRLRGLKLGVAGKDRTGAALATSFVVGPLALFVRGQEIEIPAGTVAEAKLAEPVAAPSPSTPASSPTPTSEE